MRLSQLILSVVSIFACPVFLAHSAQNQEGRFVDIQPVPGLTSVYPDASPAVTGDDLVIVFASTRPDGFGGRDLYIATRASVDEPFGQPVNVGAAVNTADNERNPNLSLDGLVLYFSSGLDMYLARRASREDHFDNLESLGDCVGSEFFESDPSITRDGLELYFFSDRAWPLSRWDVWRATRQDTNQPFCDVVNLTQVNSPDDELHCSISANGLALFFDSDNRSPSVGQDDIWMATRASRQEEFGAPVNLNDFSLGSEVNTAGPEATGVSPNWPEDGAKFYFAVDFNHIYEATWIASPPAVLRIARQSSSLLLSWDDHPLMDFALEASPRLSAPAWEYTATGRTNPVAVTDSSSVGFFRLSRVQRLQITNPPVSRGVALGADVTFDGGATGAGSLNYQWDVDGSVLEGATDSILTITNVQPVNEGNYSVIVTDDFGSITSDAARLTVLIRPILVEHPQSQTATVGDTVVLSVTVTNTATLPIWYRWRFGFQNLTHQMLNQRTSSYTIHNVQATNAGVYSVVVTNAAFFTPGILSQPATLEVLEP